jgi:hypothetical protein
MPGAAQRRSAALCLRSAWQESMRHPLGAKPRRRIVAGSFPRNPPRAPAAALAFFPGLSAPAYQSQSCQHKRYVHTQENMSFAVKCGSGRPPGAGRGQQRSAGLALSCISRKILLPNRWRCGWRPTATVEGACVVHEAVSRPRDAFSALPLRSHQPSGGGWATGVVSDGQVSQCCPGTLETGSALAADAASCTGVLRSTLSSAAAARRAQRRRGPMGWQCAGPPRTPHALVLLSRPPPPQRSVLCAWQASSTPADCPPRKPPRPPQAEEQEPRLALWVALSDSVTAAAAQQPDVRGAGASRPCPGRHYGTSRLPGRAARQRAHPSPACKQPACRG